MRPPAFAWAVALVSLPVWLAGAAAPNTPTYNPPVAAASEEGRRAIGRFEVAPGVKAELTAAEPLLANPVAFCIDERGNFYVAETFRLHAGVTDNRQHRWTDDDLSSRTVADRLAMYRKHLGDKFASYGVEHDRVRKLVDTDGDGRPDRATVFADGFNAPEAGLGSGVLARGGKVWYTCIPDLWLLRDRDGDGRADEKKSLHTGYGIHVAFLGHDLHGLKFGPDGKLYFSVGDRGLHVETEGRTLSVPDCGSVLRCNPDGSELEVVATGLRNPQELVFDEHGDLFTCDNNADAGDQARWVHLVEGGDSGWRLGWQYLTAPPDRLGAWKAEKMWEPRNPDQPAHILPPLANISSGPSGLTYHPGVSLLPERYKKHFFLCDFKGGPGLSGVHTFQVKPKGASFELVNPGKLVWQVLATDAEFGPDGGLYVSDWVDGWRVTGKGRLYKFFDPARVNDPKVAEVKKLLAEGMDRRPSDELVRLLGHEDMRIRQEAQFALAAQGGAALPPLAKVAGAQGERLPRLHAVWGLGQLLRDKTLADAVVTQLLPLTGDGDAEVRAQSAKVLGTVKSPAAVGKLLPLLKDESPRVRFQAALSLGKQGDERSVGPVLEMLRANNDEDAYLRHAGVMALAGLKNRGALRAHASDPSPAVRLGVLLAMRRLKAPDVAGFLNDAVPALVLEAARAIHDEPIRNALPQLAAVAGRTGQPDALTYRALNAHFRLGTRKDAEALARYAANPAAPESMRLEAVKHLANWAKPSRIDRVTGLYYPLAERPADVAAEALKASLAGLATAPEKVRAEAAKVAAGLGVREVGPLLAQLVADAGRPSAVRVESLKALASLKDERLAQAMRQGLTSNDARLRGTARDLLARRDPAAALPELRKALETGEVAEKQQAVATLAELKLPGATELLAEWVDRLTAGRVEPELRLDVREAAARRGDAALKAKLEQYEASLSGTDHLAKYREALQGGDAEAGRKLFFDRSELSCVRCHRVQGTGGNVGPDLTQIGKDQKREYILESIVAPSQQIAKGYDSVTLVLDSGEVKSGIFKSEEHGQITLMNAEGALLSVPSARVEERLRGKSAMPEDLLQHLTRPELRDLVEYLSSLR